jgi:hypothetical protein
MTNLFGRIFKAGNGELYAMKCEEGDIMFEQHGTGQGLPISWKALVSKGFTKHIIMSGKYILV